MAQIIRFYNRIGVHDYDWHVFGPDLDEIEWEYHTFDPPEERLWAPGNRYREVTFPKGMEAWYTPDFNAVSAGWKKGFAPFGQWDGKLVTDLGPNETVIDRGGRCDTDFCRCYEPMKTLWDKEVLIMRTKVKLPKFKEGHRYRVLIGGMAHVPSGEGYRLYLNGKQILERNRGIGRREGGVPQCYYIDKAWWPAFDEEVTVAAIGFLHNFGGKHAPGVKRQHFSIWFQEMKNPPLTEEMYVRGKAMQPMRCTAWQETKQDEDKFYYDGKFVANDAIAGRWVQVGQVADIADFTAGSTPTPDPNWPREISFAKDGKTDSERFVWSGDVLMDLNEFQALQITPKTMAGSEYLFIEAGGYSRKDRDGWKPDHAPDWKPALFVMRRK
jgi:hypothetical protein